MWTVLVPMSALGRTLPRTGRKESLAPRSTSTLSADCVGVAKTCPIPSSLQADWQDQLQQSQAEQEERDAMLARFGIGDLSPEEMKTTPSLRNLNEDPLMSDSLVYFLKPGVTAFGCQKENEDDEAAEEYEDETEYSVRLYGAGMMPRHCQLSYDPADGGPNRVLELIAQKGVVFVNGKQVEDGTVTALKHNDRIIMGNSQVFKVNDPVNAPVGGGPKQHWQLARAATAGQVHSWSAKGRRPRLPHRPRSPPRAPWSRPTRYRRTASCTAPRAG